MGTESSDAKGPDLARGIDLSDLPDGGLLEGHVGEEAVVLARRGDEVFALGGRCTHYSAPLADGIVVGDTLHCPWHHACFSLRSGEALGAPAFDPLACWRVERRGERIFVREKRESPAFERAPTPANQHPDRIVIVGGGAAGFAAAEMLRRRGFGGDLTMISSDSDAPYDRPNVSKDYLAGQAPDAWIPLKGPDFYAEGRIDLQLRTTISRIDVASRTAIAEDGRTFPFDRLLLATGAEPARLSIPGADQPHVQTLRSLADSRRIIALAEGAKNAVVVGASFIGLEVAAALRTRGVGVQVVAPDARPMEKVLGPEFGEFIQSLHEQHGVTFHLRNTAVRISRDKVELQSGAMLDADLVVIGIGVSPRIALAEQAGIRTDHGVLVNEYLETSAPGIFAAGDIARWPDARTGATMRVEHWVVAERQGQTAAVNLLGGREPFSDVPFFWSQHYDVSIRYVGHAQSWDSIIIEGDIAARDGLARYVRGGKTLAIASIGRDVEALRWEASMEGAPDARERTPPLATT